jgi:hypothetical protein
MGAPQDLLDFRQSFTFLVQSAPLTTYLQNNWPIFSQKNWLVQILNL